MSLLLLQNPEHIFVQVFETVPPIEASSFDVTYMIASSNSTHSIESGMNNTIIVPSSIFTNSYFYKHEIEDGNGATNWPNLTSYGDNKSSDNTTAHISGIITGNLTGDEVLELLTELSKNTTGTVTYNYSLEDPTQLNLPPDALKLVPFSGYVKKLDGKTVILKNARTSDIQEPPTISANGGYDTVNGLMDSIKQKLQGAVNLGISVGTAVWDKAVEVGTELAHIVCSAITAVAVKFTEFVVQLGKAIIDFGKKAIGAFETALNEVKAAVDKVVDILVSWATSLINYLLEIMAKAADKYYEATKDWSGEGSNVTGSVFDWSFVDYLGNYGWIRMLLSVFSEVSGLELYYELWGFPRYHQEGDTCSYYTLMEVANYFGKNHDLEDVKRLSGDTDTSNGMKLKAIGTYLRAVGIYEDEKNSQKDVSFDDIKQEIHSEGDPIVYTAKNYYQPNSDMDHTVAIVGYFEFAGNKYVMIADTNYPYFSPYPQRWDFITTHFDLMDFTEG